MPVTNVVFGLTHALIGAPWQFWLAAAIVAYLLILSYEAR